MDLNLQLNLAENLRILRQYKSLSQAAMANEISICRSSYCQYETGERMPDVTTLYAISKFYHISIDTLIHGNIRQVLSDYFLYDSCTRDEQRLLTIFANLSPCCKGKLLERGEQLMEEDNARKRKSLY